MTHIKEARQTLVARILEGDGRAPEAQRRAAFHNSGLGEPLRTLIDRIARRAPEVRGEEIDAVRASGFSEDQIFELAVCAAIGEATRQYDSALAALEAATRKE